MARSGIAPVSTGAETKTTPAPPKSVPRDVDVDRIFVTKNNLRTEFDTPDDVELVEDVRRRGVLSRLWVRDNSKWTGKDGKSLGRRDYDLIAGERRLRAAKAAGLTKVPCEVFDVDDETAEDLMTIENLQRTDLHELDYAAGFARMIRQRDYTVEQLAQTVSKGKTFIREHLGFANLPDNARQAFRENKISKSVAVLIATVPGEKQRENYATKVITGRFDRFDRGTSEPLSFRKAKELKEREFMKDLAGASFPLDQQLDPAWPYSCLTCPHYNGNTEETRQGKRPNICLNPQHYPVMVAEWGKLQAQKAEDGGDTVLSASEAKRIFDVRHNGKIFLRDDKYVDVGETFMDSSDGGKSKPWGPVVKKAGLSTVTAIDPQGRSHKLVLTTEAESAARAQGFNKGSSSASSASARDPKASAEKKKKNAVRRAVAARIVMQLGKLRAPHARLSQPRTIALVEWMIKKAGGKSFLVKQLGVDVKKIAYSTDWCGALSNHAKSLGSIGLVPFMVQVMAVDVIESWAIADWGGGNPDKETLALCKLFGIDIRKIQSQELAQYNAALAARKKKVPKAVRKIKRRARVGRQSAIGRRKKA